jgi:hypothetical protein
VVVFEGKDTDAARNDWNPPHHQIVSRNSERMVLDADPEVTNRLPRAKDAGLPLRREEFALSLVVA